MKNEKNKTEIIEKWKQNDRVIRYGPSWLWTESIWFLTMLWVHRWQLFPSPLLLFVVVIERLRSVLRPNRRETLGVANRSKPSAVSCRKSGWKKNNTLYSYRTYRLKQNCFTGAFELRVRRVRRYTTVNRIFYFTKTKKKRKQ